MAKEDDVSNSEQELSKSELKFSQEQYEMLKRCSDKKDITEWNEWRDKNNSIDVELEAGNFSNWYLKNVNLGTGSSETPEVYLRRAKFDKAHLEGATFTFAHLEFARFHESHLEGSNLMFAHLDKSFLLGVHLEGACLQCAELPNAKVCNAHLNRSNFVDSHLQGSELDNACLIGAKFRKAHISGSTSFCYCEVDHETDLREVGIESVRIDTGTKQLLEYNIRRKNWEDWYKEHWFFRWLVWPFWVISDYGRSTGRIVATFFILAFAFAAVYANCAFWCPPGIVSNLIVEPHSPIWHYFLLVLFRPIYFSVVTMTTLGFGDMYANANSILGHIFLIIQVILGYVLLGALVTRFAFLFTAGGPAGKFTEKTKENGNSDKDR